MSDTQHGEHLAEGSLISHLLELRNRLVKALIAIVVAFVPCAFFANKLFQLIATPLTKQLPADSSMISTSVVAPFMVPVKLALIVAIVIAMPVVLYQIWSFVSPGLYRKEKRFAVPLLVSSILLFYAGVVFAYFLVFPLAFKFFIATTPVGVRMMTDISSYLDFATMMVLAFGAAFEIPVATVLLLWTGIVRIEAMVENRGYVLIGIAVVSALITPADAMSMLLMLIPMYLLYELGIIAGRILLRQKQADQVEETKQAAQD
jgi:sec-independent protein translocase protein TatC